MAAACGHCGGTVMPWRKHIFYLRITASCQQCGTRVRLQGWQFSVAIVVILGAAGVATLVFLESAALSASAFAALAVAGIVLDWWSWKTFGWAPEPGATEPD